MSTLLSTSQHESKLPSCANQTAPIPLVTVAFTAITHVNRSNSWQRVFGLALEELRSKEVREAHDERWPERLSRLSSDVTRTAKVPLQALTHKAKDRQGPNVRVMFVAVHSLGTGISLQRHRW